MAADQLTSRDWPAPAKLNRFLHILGRRADGYHRLQTVFQFLDYGDRLDFTLRRDGAIHRLGDIPGVAADDDLVVRAARVLQDHTGSALGADIAVTKRLPLGAGLGGGSSDGATTLVALNRLWDTGLSTEALAALGLTLGADLPVFVHGRAAWAEGVGEALTPVALDEPWFLVLIPPVTVSTAGVFGDAQLTRDSAPITISDFLSGQGGNDCEPVVFRRYPEVREAFEWLSQRAPTRLTGTGAGLFAAFADEAGANGVLDELPAPWRGFVARGQNRSPLLTRLQQSG